MRTRVIREEPFKSIIDREWRRAKRILPSLKRKPKVVWASSFYWKDWYGQKHYRSSRVGECWQRQNLIKLHTDYKKAATHKEFVLTLRHEFAHLPHPTSGQQSHGKDFLWWMEKLGGSRYAKAIIEKATD